MNKILKSVAVIAFVAAIAVGATSALYSDNETLSNITFATDTMALKIDNDPVGANYNWVDGFDASGAFAALKPGASKLKPGDADSQIIDIKNVGGIDGSATIKFDITSGVNDLTNNLVFTVTYDGNHDGTFETAVASGPLSVWNGNVYTLGPIISGVTVDGPSFSGKIASVKIAWSISSTVGNEIQGQSVTFNTTFGLNQTL